MSNPLNQFSHLPLRLTNEGTARTLAWMLKISERTQTNRENPSVHGSKLNSSVLSIISNWEAERENRKKEGTPELPDTISFILQVDPCLFDADALRSFGIEVVADLEDGYIIGASADRGLLQLRKKIEQFIKSERGGGKVSAIWEIFEGTKRPEHILSPNLQAHWNQISDNQEYIVNVSISCIRIQEQYSSCPKLEYCKSNVNSRKNIDKWLNRYNLTSEEWDNLYLVRKKQLDKFIQNPLCNGEILRDFYRENVGILLLNDSFSCRIRIVGKFLRDLVLNFPYIIEADLEEGYIIGGSTNRGLSELRKKIQQLINFKPGGGKVPEIWEILEGTKRPEYILSPELQDNWDRISDGQEYIVDVGISCINIQEQYSKCPKRENFGSDTDYSEKVNEWLDKHNLTSQEWDDLYLVRYDHFNNFIRQPLYRGEILVPPHDYSGSILPDSFSCRIRILGKGLKDLVLNFPYIFDVSEADEFIAPSVTPNSSESDREQFELEAPEPNAPKVCIIDSGIQEIHPKLKVAIDSTLSRSWVPRQTNITADYVEGGGHGTRVAGAVLYPRFIPETGRQQAVCWLQNARILDDRNELPKLLFPPNILEEIVAIYYHQTRTRIYNHSIARISPCRTQSMTPWAAAIDKLSWENDVLFIVAAGNIEARKNFVTRPSISAHIQADRNYPEYLLQPSARIANPAQSFQALTVGSIAHRTYNNPPLRSIAEENHPSAFSCSLGIWDTIKPEVVEYGGDYVIDSLTSPNFTTPESVCPELVRSTRDGGKSVSADAVGTSFAAPKVTHIAAALAAELPQESTLLYRALIVQSARLPDWTNNSNATLYHAIRTMGYGIPDINRALGNSPNRVTLITRELERIKAQQAKVYQVQVPENFLPQGEGFDILIEITLSYVAEPRRTRRDRRKYLSTWLDWTCSKKGEDPDRFLKSVLKDYDAAEETEEDEGVFQWTLGKRQLGKGKTRANGIDGRVKELSRSKGTIQKDWATVKSYELREGFCIAVVGHAGWNQDSNAEVPFALAVSFEAINSSVNLYTSFVEAEAKALTKVEPQQKIQIQQSV